MNTNQVQKRPRGRPRKLITKVLSQEEQKIVFLNKLVEFGTVKRACEESGLHRSTLYLWVRENIISKEEIDDALLQHVDGTLDIAITWATRGIPTYARDGHGGVAYGADGNPLVEYKPSERILLKLLERHPEFKRTTSEQNGHSQQSVFVVESDQPTDLVHTVLHVRLIDYDETGRQILIDAMRAAEQHKSAE